MSTAKWFSDIKLSFYDKMCNVDFLCWQGEPNFFGWTLITVMAVILGFVILGAIANTIDQFLS